jgi:hypothetical protein
VIRVCTLLALTQPPDVAATAASKLRPVQLTPINFYAPQLLQSN